MAEGTSEVETLIAYLNAQRRHILKQVEGLDEATLHTGTLPSGWTFAGLVQHLALDVERFWFRGAVAADPEAIAWVEADDGQGWHVAPEVPAASIIELYQREIDLANAIIRAGDPERPAAWWPADLGDGPPDTLREIALHVIAETACHAGQLDAARELLDGRQWLVLQ